MKKDYQLLFLEELGLNVSPKLSPTNIGVLGGIAFYDKKQSFNFEKTGPIPNNFIGILNRSTNVISQI